MFPTFWFKFLPLECLLTEISSQPLFTFQIARTHWHICISMFQALWLSYLKNTQLWAEVDKITNIGQHQNQEVISLIGTMLFHFLEGISPEQPLALPITICFRSVYWYRCLQVVHKLFKFSTILCNSAPLKSLHDRPAQFQWTIILSQHLQKSFPCCSFGPHGSHHLT